LVLLYNHGIVCSLSRVSKGFWKRCLLFHMKLANMRLWKTLLPLMKSSKQNVNVVDSKRIARQIISRKLRALILVIGFVAFVLKLSKKEWHKVRKSPCMKLFALTRIFAKSSTPLDSTLSYLWRVQWGI